jgi:hypothetical protein
VVGLLATAGAAYRILQNEDALSRERAAAASEQAAVSRTAELLFDIRASLHAYVAPGQGLPFWTKHTQEAIDRLRQSVVDLDAMLKPATGSLSETLDGIDQLAAAEKRVRTHAANGEMQLAGDVIFTEVRDLLAAATTQVLSVRDGLARAHDRQAATLRDEQALLAAGALGVWIVIALLLLPTGPKGVVKDPGEWRNELKESLKKPIPVAPDPVKVAEPQVTIVPGIEINALKEASEICSDLSALADPGALEGALARVCTILNATGLIVWIASNDSSTLSPVATSGFDPKLVARIGKIGRDSSNLTAAAFREGVAKVSPMTPTAPAALAVPMCSPTGAAGVVSVELKPGQPVDDSKVSLAAIVAAQLATLAMPIPASPERAPTVSSELTEPKTAAR